MLTLDDCIAFSGLTESEVRAIAEHERVTDIVAAELGCNLLRTRRGVRAIRRMIVDDIRAARDCGDRAHARELKQVLFGFGRAHRSVAH